MRELKDYEYYRTDLGVLYCGDCLEILPLLEKESIDLVLTDPPYGLNYQSNWGAKTGNLKEKIANDEFNEWLRFILKPIKEFERITKEDSEWYIFCGGGGGGGEAILAYMWLELKKLEVAKVKNLLIWDKEFVGMGWDWRFQYETIFQLQKGNGLNNSIKGSTRSNILRCKNEIPQKDDHPTPKPIGLSVQILEPKTNKNSVVLDSFVGSGRILLACEKLGRKWVGIEISEEYCEIAKKRIKAEADQLKLFK